MHPDAEIHFHFEETDAFPIATDALKSWLYCITQDHDYQISVLNYIFCSDEYLLGINQQYLDHDYYTDIITFDNSDQEQWIEGDIFISVDRVKENAATYRHPFQSELLRVIAHGLLHLIGFQDKTDAEKKEMRKKEDACLSLWSQISKDVPRGTI